MKEELTDVTALVCQFKTRELIQRCVESFREHYPHIPLVIVDDGSRDESTEYTRELGEHEGILTVISEDNQGHGPAMNLGITYVDTPYVFTMDSDCTIEKDGLLEGMREIFDDYPITFAVGKQVPRYKTGGLYIRPSAMMMDIEKFHKLRPFILHGAPALHTMTDAEKHGYALVDFPVLDYIDLHGGSGTRRAVQELIERGEIDGEEFSRLQPMLKHQLRGAPQ